jgi:hypothetical protein
MSLLIQQDTAFVFRQSSHVKTNFKEGTRLGAKDHIVCYKRPKATAVWMSKEDHLKLPNDMFIREFSVNGTIYVTSLMKPRIYPKKELANLYGERWNVELDLRTIKTDMGMEMLRCKTPAMVDKEIAVNLLAYNLVCANIAHSAYTNHKKPHHISFMATAQLIHSFVGLCITMTSKALVKLLKPLLKAMAYTEIGKRKRPNQPRVVKRRPKAMPLMTKPRSEYAII